MNKLHDLVIRSVKYDGKMHRQWEGNYLLDQGEEYLLTGNVHALVTEADGSKRWTSDPALAFFPRNRWYNIIVILKEDSYYFYCNISSPFRLVQDEVHYVDYDLDLIVEPDLSYHIIDLDEYEANKRRYRYPKDLECQIKAGVEQVIEAINSRSVPFDSSFVKRWSRKLKQVSGDRT